MVTGKDREIHTESTGQVRVSTFSQSCSMRHTKNSIVARSEWASIPLDCIILHIYSIKVK